MKNIILITTTILLLNACQSAPTAATATSGNTERKFCDFASCESSEVTVKAKPVPHVKLPHPSPVPLPPKNEIKTCTMDTVNVLIIGDSVSRDNTPYVKASLGAKYFITRIKGTPEDEAIKPENGAYSGWTLSRLPLYLSQCPKWDVIVWNNGIWDVSHPEDIDVRSTISTLSEYSQNIHDIGVALAATNAKVIFLTTTPIGINGPTKSPCQPELVPVYNAEAERVLTAIPGVKVADFYSYALEHVELMTKDNTHWDYPGRKYLSRFMINEIEEALQ